MCRKLSEMRIEVEAENNWVEFKTFPVKPWQIVTTPDLRLLNHPELAIPAYQLDELPAVLRALPNGMKRLKTRGKPQYEWELHWENICSMYAQSGSLGEGSEVERYILDLIK